MSGNDTSRALRQAAALGDIGSEETMYPILVEALNRLLPTGFEARSHASNEEGRPDVSIVRKLSGAKAAEAAPVAHIEVKHAATMDSAFRPDGSGEHQIARYRRSGLPVLLTDGLCWFDVTDSDDLSLPAARFGDDCDPAAAEQQLRSLLHSICQRRPRYTTSSAVDAMAGIVAQIDASVDDNLADSWQVVRTALGFGGSETLDDSERGIGEIIAFTLLSIAVHLPALPADEFMPAAAAEWEQEGTWSDPEILPAVMQAALEQFRLHLKAKQAFGAAGWPTIRAVAAYLGAGDRGDDSYPRLSRLWDDYLAKAGRRKTLGSWQTPEAVARFQVRQAHEALQRLGYAKGFGDQAVTVIDPCVGTGVYLDAVIAEAACPPQAFNADGPYDKPRMLGADISPTAVAATHIRITATGAEPQLHMTDTLHTSAEVDARPLLDHYEHSLSQVVAAARWDWHEMNRWADRDPGRDPILAIIGNPPYLRAGLDQERYEGTGWRKDVYETWREGSGGHGGALPDLFVGFWAWAFNVCRQPHGALPDDNAPKAEPQLCGVVSFITNRAWIHGKQFGPMRRWVRSRATLTQVTDFGPGTRGGGAGRWSSKQPFAIQTGTAIVTLTFDPTDSARTLRYQRAIWSAKEQSMTFHGEGFSADYDPSAVDASWTLHIKAPERILLRGMTTVSGIITADDSKWISIGATKSRALRFAYRVLDNRYSPNQPPQKVRRGEPAPPEMASGYSEWCIPRLFGPHEAHIQEGGWYAILQALGVKPGPAIHATTHLPDFSLFKGSEGGKVVRVGPGVKVPVDYRHWADSHALSGEAFWHYALAASHHPDYWIAGSVRAETLAHHTVEIPLTDDPDTVLDLVDIGKDLVVIWSVDTLPPVPFDGHPGSWRFESHNELEGIRINGRDVLKKWREARPGDWDRLTADEYARTVQALTMLLDIKAQVGALLD